MTTEFGLIGIAAFLVIWLFQRHTISMKWRTAGGIGLVSVAALGIYALRKGAGLFLGDQPWYNSSPYREIIFLLLMIIGMAARYLTGIIEERRERIQTLVKEGKSVKSVRVRFDAWEFAYPLLFSVVTFGGLIAQLKEEGLVLANVILSFQTGFFWQTVLKKQISTN